MAFPLEIEGRTPGVPPMRTLPVKLPASGLEQLQQQAQRMGCFPSALARALVLRGLSELEGEP